MVWSFSTTIVPATIARMTCSEGIAPLPSRALRPLDVIGGAPIAFLSLLPYAVPFCFVLIEAVSRCLNLPLIRMNAEQIGDRNGMVIQHDDCSGDDSAHDLQRRHCAFAVPCSSTF